MSGRFVSVKEMAHYKWEEAVRNRLVKAGEYKRSNHTDICVCGCGAFGCHFEYDLTKYYKEKSNEL